ncbi:MAG: hypothetical protein Q7J78_00705 [Clostridiales bacterium]|nr:hypothetical protein [Clostridiales bacterium]
MNIVKYDGSHKILPRDYIITEFIDSIPLNDTGFPREYSEKILFELRAYTAKMHNVKSDRFGWPQPDNGIIVYKNGPE